MELHFSKEDIIILTSIKSQLFNAGFDFECADEQIVFKGLPTILNEDQVKTALEAVAVCIKSEVPEDAFSQNMLIARLLAERSAVKVGARLVLEEQLQLVNQLFACKETQLSPSNRPIFTTIELTDLDKKLN